MRRSLLIALALVALPFLALADTAASAALTAESQAYEVSIYHQATSQRNDLITSTAFLTLPGQVNPLNVQRQQAYQKTWRTDAKGQTFVTPGVAREGIEASFTAGTPQSDRVALDYHIHYTRIASINAQGPEPRIQVPVMAPPVDAEGTITLAPHETVNLPMSEPGYTLTLRRTR
jgi:hypothetical protein